MKLYNFHFGGLAGLENKNCYKYNEYLCLIKKKTTKKPTATKTFRYKI